MTATLVAYWDSYKDASHPIFADVVVEFGEDGTAAEALLAQLPKSLGARVIKCARHDSDRSYVTFSVEIHAKLSPTKGNDRNENGIKRLASAQRKLAALGLPVEFHVLRNVRGMASVNAYLTRESFEAAIS